MEDTYEAIVITKNEMSKEVQAFFDKEVGEGNYNFAYEGYKNLAYSIQGCEKAHYYYINGLELSRAEVLVLSEHLIHADFTLRSGVFKER